MNIRVVAGFLIIVLGIMLQLFFGEVRGMWISFVLGALISLSFLLNFFEILFLTLFSLLVLNWQPGISPELAVFGILPLMSFLARKFLPFEPWVGSMLLTVAGIVIVYAFFGIRVITETPRLFFLDLALSLLWSAIIFKAMISFFRAEDLDL